MVREGGLSLGEKRIRYLPCEALGAHALDGMGAELAGSSEPIDQGIQGCISLPSITRDRTRAVGAQQLLEVGRQGRGVE